MGYVFERMADNHRKPVIDIFNHYVKNNFAAYAEAPLGYEFFDSWLKASKGYPALVAKTEGGEVVGFAFLKPYLAYSTFKKTAQITYFILPNHTRRGLGKRILEQFVEQARIMGVDNLLAHVSSLNKDSLDFHLRNGFQECGRFREIGNKFGKTFDLIWLQRRL